MTDIRALCRDLADHLQARVSKEDQGIPARGYLSQSQQLIDRARAALAQPEAGEAWAVDALRELSEAFYDQFFGADDGLSPRLISAANEAQRLLVTQGRPAAPPAPETDDGDVAIDRWIEGRPDWPEGWAGVTQCQLTALIGKALEHWGRPAAPPAPPAQEVGAALADLENLELAFESSFECKVRTSRIRPALLHYATLLQQQAAPAPAVVPVAVSDRLPGEGDCDEFGHCWWWCDMHNEWQNRKSTFAASLHHSHWLPASAIPLPQAGLPWRTDGPAVQNREPASVVAEANLTPAPPDGAAPLDCTSRSQARRLGELLLRSKGSEAPPPDAAAAINLQLDRDIAIARRKRGLPIYGQLDRDIAIARRKRGLPIYGWGPGQLNPPPPAPGMRREYLWSPSQMAECGGPCWEAQDPRCCDCGALWRDVPAVPAKPQSRGGRLIKSREEPLPPSEP